MRRIDDVLSGFLALVGILLIVLVVVACAPSPEAEVGKVPSPTPAAEVVDPPSPTPPAAAESPLATGTPPPLTVVSGGPQVADQVAPKGEEDTMFLSPTGPTPDDPGRQSMVAQAAKDLAKRLSIAGDQIELLEIKGVVWPDGSLGCPRRGMAYTQVPVDGSLIRLRVGKEVYNYHSGGSKGPFLCEQE